VRARRFGALPESPTGVEHLLRAKKSNRRRTLVGVTTECEFGHMLLSCLIEFAFLLLRPLPTQPPTSRCDLTRPIGVVTRHASLFPNSHCHTTQLHRHQHPQQLSLFKSHPTRFPSTLPHALTSSSRCSNACWALPFILFTPTSVQTPVGIHQHSLTSTFRSPTGVLRLLDSPSRSH
jgi:hypothetical protein